MQIELNIVLKKICLIFLIVRRSKRGNCPDEAFRDAYGKLAILKSMCRECTPVLALTGTADQVTQKVICSTIAINNATKLFVSPNRATLRFEIQKVSKNLMLSKLDWIVQMVKVANISMPKTIIFCDTIYALAQVVNYLTYATGQMCILPKQFKEKERLFVRNIPLNDTREV
mgnify:CR=1 FL=1